MRNELEEILVVIDEIITIKGKFHHRLYGTFPRVIVNGKTVINKGVHTGVKPGRFDFLHR
jgi:hypothetical protein